MRRQQEAAFRGARDGARVRRQQPDRDPEEPVGTRGGRPLVRFEPERAEPARAVPRLPHHRQQHRRAERRGVHGAGNRRRPLPVERRVPHAIASQADAGVRSPRRRVAGSDRREALRSGDADSVDAALHRERGSGGRLFLRLLVRLHRLDQLGLAVAAAADDSRSASRVRSAVRRRRHAGRAQATPVGGSQHPRLAGDVNQPDEERPRRRRPRAFERLPGRCPRDRTADPEGGGLQLERRAARAPRRAGWRARLVHRARQADVRPAGARVRVGPHARVRLQAGPRRLEPRVSGERVHGRVPFRVASPGERGEDPRLREDQQVPRQPGAVLPGEAEEHVRRRQQPARELGDPVRLADGRFERPQSQARADVHRRPRGRRAEGPPARQGARGHADGQRDAHPRARARARNAQLRRQQRNARLVGRGGGCDRGWGLGAGGWRCCEET